MATITYNGQEIEVPNGANITINGNGIKVNGDMLISPLANVPHVIIKGDVGEINCMSCTVNGNVKGDIDCTSLTVNGNITGDVDATSVKAETIRGKIDATSVRGNIVK